MFADESLVHSVSKLEEFGYGRLPVLDRGEIRSSGWSQRAISSRDCFRSCRSIIMKKRSTATYEAEMNVIIYAARDFDIASTVGQGTTLKISIPTGGEEKRCA